MNIYLEYQKASQIITNYRGESVTEILREKSTIISNMESDHFQLSGLRAMACVYSINEYLNLGFIA